MEANNIAALREAAETALTTIRGIISGTIARTNNAVFDCRDKLKSALSAPPRNCDLYDDVEDSWRDYKQFRSQKGEDIYFDMVHFWPFAKWLLSPAEELKGEGNGR